MQQTIQLWLENKPGALMRVAGILTAKGINIEALSVSPDPSHDISQMVIVADVELRLRARVLNEINRLVNVLLAIDVSGQTKGAPAAVRLPIEPK
jgi:acetolactate synthase-1/3 small subunit